MRVVFNVDSNEKIDFKKIEKNRLENNSSHKKSDRLVDNHRNLTLQLQ